MGPATPRPLGSGLKELFPALQRRLRDAPLTYLDSACLTVPPEPVVQATQAYYHQAPGCHGRSAHQFSREASEGVERARQAIAGLVNARRGDTLVFTRNATEAIQLVASGMAFRQGDVVLGSDLEHNSNLLPWQRLADTQRIEHRVFRTAPDTGFDEQAFLAQLDDRVRLVAVTCTSNVSGVSLPVERIAHLAHQRGARVLVDASQGLPARRVDLKAWNADFVACSLHKAYGPTGVGVLAGATDALRGLEPLLVGGGTVDDASFGGRTPADVPERLEAGLMNYAGVVACARAADFLGAWDAEVLERHFRELNAALQEGLAGIPDLHLLGPRDASRRGSIFNFSLPGRSAFDLVRLLDRNHGIMLRAGMHCAHAWYHARGEADSVRASFGVYTGLDDVERLVHGLMEFVRYY
jgi:cysteine desulfurase/selenocysteine lyase